MVLLRVGDKSFILLISQVSKIEMNGKVRV